MRTFEEQLKQEALTVGRPIEYRDAWECVFNGRDGYERTLRVMIYDVDPIDHGEITIHESRFVVWDGVWSTGGIVEADS